jgi:hypothetical protein
MQGSRCGNGWCVLECLEEVKTIIFLGMSLSVSAMAYKVMEDFISWQIILDFFDDRHAMMKLFPNYKIDKISVKKLII